MSIVERKLCADCGEANLDDETRCWACGSFHFATAGARVAGERTVYIGEALEVTQEWERGRPSWMPLVYLGSAACVALFMCIIGFWLGRSSAPETAQAQQPPSTVQSSPISLPTPPTGLSVPAQTYNDPQSGTFQDPDPDVTVRPLPSTQAMAVPTPRRTQHPPTSVIVPPIPRPAASQRVTTVYSGSPAPDSMPVVQPSVPAPSRSTAVVALRNDTDMTIEVAFEGTDLRTARVGGGSTIPLVLGPGSYQLRVSGNGAAPGKATTLLTEGKTYSLTVNSQREGGTTRLVVIEPAVDGTGG